MEDFNNIKITHGPTLALLVDNPTKYHLIDKGAHGAVFKLSGNQCVKIYADESNAEKEAKSYRLGQESEIIPRLYETGKNYIVMEYIEGITVWKHLSRTRELTMELSKKLIYLLREMERLGFTRRDSSLRHIFITKDNELKVIDLVYAYVKKDLIPIKVLTELKKIDLAKTFLAHVQEVDHELFDRWKGSIQDFLL